MPSPPGPGPVAAVHRITITVAFLGTIAYVVWAVVHGEAGGALAGVAAAVVVGLYLRNLRARLDRKLTPREPVP